MLPADVPVRIAPLFFVAEDRFIERFTIEIHFAIVEDYSVRYSMFSTFHIYDISEMLNHPLHSFANKMRCNR